MAFNNVLPVWLIMDLCVHCLAELETKRVDKPGQMDHCSKCKEKKDD